MSVGALAAYAARVASPPVGGLFALACPFAALGVYLLWRNRRRFRFSLRTLLVVVTVVCVWLGLEFRFVREREAWIRVNKALVRPAEPTPVGSTVGEFIYSRPTNSHFPFWRRWFGDSPVPSIVFPMGRTDYETAKRLFPEATLCEVSAMRP